MRKVILFWLLITVTVSLNRVYAEDTSSKERLETKNLPGVSSQGSIGFSTKSIFSKESNKTAPGISNKSQRILPQTGSRLEIYLPVVGLLMIIIYFVISSKYIFNKKVIGRDYQ